MRGYSRVWCFKCDSSTGSMNYWLRSRWVRLYRVSHAARVSYVTSLNVCRWHDRCRHRLSHIEFGSRPNSATSKSPGYIEHSDNVVTSMGPVIRKFLHSLPRTGTATSSGFQTITLRILEKSIACEYNNRMVAKIRNMLCKSSRSTRFLAWPSRWLIRVEIFIPAIKLT